jgi:SAM-dependent methyltransferase
MSFNDHFSAQSREYAAYRPTYPRELAAFLARTAPGRELAWDAATGQGQAARLLAPEFRHVLATDASAAQLANAEPVERVEFRVGDAAESGLADRACDLVTVAQAAHWFDLDRFYAEVRRVLRPRGVIAVWGYVLLQTRDARIDGLLQEFQDVGVGPYWPRGREILEAKYETLPFPFERVAAPPFFMRARWTREDLLGYVGSWSAVARYRQQHGADPMPAFAEEMSRAWPAGRTIDIEWPIYILIGRVSG